MPEIIVVLFAVLLGEPRISVDDIVCSNVFNIGIVLGILEMFGYLKTCCTKLLMDLTGTLFLSSLILLFLLAWLVLSFLRVWLFPPELTFVILDTPPILLGAKIIAIVTSLPEFTIDLAAVRRGRGHLAIGDIIGSNLTNLTLVLGLALLTSPSVDITILTELLSLLLITTVIFWRFLTRDGISKIGSVILLATYMLFQIIV